MSKFFPVPQVGGLHSAARKLVAPISKVLLDDGNRIVNPEGIFIILPVSIMTQ